MMMQFALSSMNWCGYKWVIEMVLMFPIHNMSVRFHFTSSQFSSNVGVLMHDSIGLMRGNL